MAAGTYKASLTISLARPTRDSVEVAMVACGKRVWKWVSKHELGKKKVKKLERKLTVMEAQNWGWKLFVENLWCQKTVQSWLGGKRNRE